MLLAFAFRVERSAKGNSRAERLESLAFDYLNAARQSVAGECPKTNANTFPLTYLYF